MPIRRRRAALAGLVTAFALASSAGAQPASFTNRAAFVAAFGATASNNLNALGPGSTIIPFGALPTGTLNGAFVLPPILPNPLSAFTIVFSQPINGFGADFTSGDPSTALGVKLSFFNGATPVGGSEFGNFGTTFLGARPCCGAFDRVVIENSTLYAGGYQFLDNLTVGVGRPGVSAVPEPATLALVASGLALVGGAARRRRRPVA